MNLVNGFMQGYRAVSKPLKQSGKKRNEVRYMAKQYRSYEFFSDNNFLKEVYYV